MKLSGITKVSRPRRESGPKELSVPFVNIAPREKDYSRGRQKFDGEDELSEAWDTGELDTMFVNPIPPPSPPRVDPTIGLTKREYERQAFGFTPNHHILQDINKWKLGLTQPTSKGSQILEPNLLEMRDKFQRVFEER
jgi:hypothetical protein